MTRGQVVLLVVFLLVALFQLVVRVLRARHARPVSEDEREEGEAIPPATSRPAPASPAPRPPSRVVRDAVPRAAARPGALPSPRLPDVRRSGPARRRPRFGPRELRQAIVFSAILAPPHGLEPPPSGEVRAL